MENLSVLLLIHTLFQGEGEIKDGVRKNDTKGETTCLRPCDKSRRMGTFDHRRGALKVILGPLEK